MDIKIINFIQSIGHRFGIHVTNASNTIDQKRINLIRNKSIDLVLDIGANEGQYGERLRKSGYKGRIISFEPLSKAFTELSNKTSSDSLWEGRNLALGSREETQEINVSQHSQSSSLLQVTAKSTSAVAATAVIGTETIKVMALDELQKDLGISTSRTYLKLDVQGYEKHVLLGAKESLQYAEAVETELSLVSLYKDQAGLIEMLTMMEDRGFYPIWFERAFTDPHSGHLLQIDAIFLHR